MPARRRPFLPYIRKASNRSPAVLEGETLREREKEVPVPEGEVEEEVPVPEAEGGRRRLA
jgi:hypothetical protein